MAKFKFNFGSDTSTTLFHNANASGNDFNMYTSCHTSGEPVFGNIRVTGTSVFSNATFGSSDNTIIDICGNSGSNYYAMLRLCPSGTQNSYLRFGGNFYSQNLSGTDFLTINSDGEVGIGNNDPTSILHIKSSQAIIQLDGTGTGATDHAGLLLQNEGSNKWHVQNHASNDRFQIYNYSQSDAGLSILSGGNVGIGTTDPQSILDIKGGDTSGQTLGTEITIHHTNNNTNDNIGRITFRNNSADNLAAIQAYTVGANTQGELSFWIDNDEKVRIDNDGNVGIGCTSPVYKLDVCGSNDLVRFRSTSDSASDSVLRMENNSGTVLFNMRGSGLLCLSGPINIGGGACFSCNNGQTSSLTLQSASGTDLRMDMKQSDGTLMGSLYANTGGEIGFLDSDGNWGYQIDTDSTHKWKIDNTDRLCLTASILCIPSAGCLKLGRSDNGRHTCLFTDNSGTQLKNDGGDPIFICSAAYIDFWSCGCSSRAMRINGNDVGIGTDSPAHKLVISCSTESDGCYLTICRDGGSSGSTNAFVMAFGYCSAKPYIDATRNNVGTQSLLLNPSGGNVGIGTDSPQRQLHVHCSSSSWDQCASLRLSSENVTNFYGEVQFHRGTSDTSDMGLNLLVSNSGSENLTPKLHVNVDGNVGIGTTTPSTKLHLGGSNNVLRIDSGTAAYCCFSQISLNDTRTTITSCIVDGTAQGDTDIHFATRVSGTTATRMIVNHFGRVGIGTTDPKHQLHVEDHIGLGTPGEASTTHSIQLARSDSGAANRAAINFKRNADGDEYITFDVLESGVNGFTPMTLNCCGNVGIGTDSPDTLLKVHQTGTSGNSYFEGSVQIGGANASYGAILGYSALNSGRVNISNLNNAGGADATIKLGFGAITTGEPANPVMTVNQSGNVGIGNTSPEARLDIQDGNIALVVGADSGATSMTDATTKTARMGVHHYTNDEEPLAIFVADSQSTTSTLYIGGGTSTLNATSFIKFYTAANGTTTTGTERMSINNSGVVCSACCFLSPVVCGSSCVSSPKVYTADICTHPSTIGSFGKAQEMNANTSSADVLQLGTSNVIEPYRDGDGSAGSGTTLSNVLQVGSYNDNKVGATSSTMIGVYNRICDTTATNNVKHSDLLIVGHSNVIKNNYFLDLAGTTGCYTEKGTIFGQYNTIDKTGIYCYDASNCYHYGSVAFGNCNCLKDVYNVAIGNDNLTEDFGSIAVGNKSCACCHYGLAIGYEAKAVNQRAIAIGFQACADSYGHMALGLTSASAWVCTNGQICAVGDIVACTSDRRLKCNILTITCAIERLKNIRGVSFEWDRDYIKKEGIKFSPREKSTTYGFIAQELEESVPDAVLEAPFAEAINKKLTDKEKYKTIKPEKIIPFLVEASKEQQLTIEKQQQQINTLTCQVEMLLKRCA